MSDAMLEFRDVDVFYGAIQALKQVSLEVSQGETVALDWRERRREIDAADVDFRAATHSQRANFISRRRYQPQIHALCGGSGHCPVAGRAAGVSGYDRRGEPADGHHSRRQ